jgi:uncharacterized lipoprotein
MGQDMKFTNLILAVAAASLLAGCGIISDRKPVDYKAGAIQTPPLEVPPDLTVPETDQRYTIPGTDGEKVANYSEYSKQTAEQPCEAPASAPAVAAPAPARPTSRLYDANGVKRIELREPFDRSWRKVGLAIDRAKLKVTDKDRSKGIYFVAVPGKEKPNDYQVVVRGTRAGSEVSAADAHGKSDAESVRLIETLYKSIE